MLELQNKPSLYQTVKSSEIKKKKKEKKQHHFQVLGVEAQILSGS